MNEETLETIEQCGLVALPVDETCAIAQITEREFAASKQAKERYRIGRLRGKFELRQTIRKAATSGDAQAIKTLAEYFETADASEFVSGLNL